MSSGSSKTSRGKKEDKIDDRTSYSVEDSTSIKFTFEIDFSEKFANESAKNEDRFIRMEDRY